MAGRPLDAPARKLTYQDYCAIPEDGLRHEILDGEHVVSPSPHDPHQRVSLNFTTGLAAFLQRAGIGTLRVAPYDTLLDDYNTLQPDLLVVLRGGLAHLERNGCHGPPDLAIEILSDWSHSRDLVRKRGIYERAGVREYWVVDPEAERVEVYRQEAPGRFARPVVLTCDRDEVLDTPLLPGLALPLTQVFAP